ncbi:hypothetical protein FPOAC2_07557 [Fusarium poae]|uniref:Cyanovirin-N domain-containing protein n=1 Tax=Fusarium poae TaxID=36050 RepID=A0A1B8AIR1_FUSPO|nr:hypothetical protein FPOAC1_007645 [Fusarium poae]KAG8668266.1 hypothetical protein FPOAC1_007645 [Fusarium poae]OBS20367.1 hypothetical protein FPOA_06739 [Fusarium poae]
MLFNTFTTSAIAAFALLAAPVVSSPIDTIPEGLESHLQSRANDVTVKFWTTTTCHTSRSRKGFNSGHCINALAGKDHAVSMQERKSTKCHMIRYREKNCQGYSEKGLNLHDCFNIGDEWESLRFKC